jgi:hypothetical protein
MPHDKHGNKLNSGDIVIVRFTVKDVYDGTDYCNLSLETVDPMYPGENKTALTLNTQQVELERERQTISSGDVGPISPELLKTL